MRSVVVVLPASMWAMIPMLRVLARGNSRMRGAPFFCCAGFACSAMPGHFHRLHWHRCDCKTVAGHEARPGRFGGKPPRCETGVTGGPVLRKSSFPNRLPPVVGEG